ncbi:MAG TPA: hypothetical protein VM925_10455 [Labilithrix sp.]|nr:hypothetical protein [Labilithrix sp.]
MSTGTSASFVLLAALGLASASCTASLELDRFRTEEKPVQSAAPINVNYFDVKFTAKSMQSHLGEYLELRVVDRLNSIQAKAIYNDVTVPDFTLYLARVVPKANAPYRLDYWADHNVSKRYDGIQGGINDKDHAWRRVLADPLPEDMRLVGSRYELEFLHDTAFVDIFTDLNGNPISGEDSLLPCDMNVISPGFVGKAVELRVLEKASGRLVGLYRQGRAKESFHALIPGILDVETQYEVLAYVDINDSGNYDKADPSWKLEFTSQETGAAVDVDTALPQTPIETGEQSTQ